MSKRYIFMPIGVLVVIILLETLLRLTDPWGIHYFADMKVIPGRQLADGTYGLTPGTYETRAWKAHILSDGYRDVPNTQAADCELVFIGDSVTFGAGVSDDETFVNLIASRLDNVHVINAGVSGHNMDMLLLDAQRFPDADILIYTVSENDMLPLSRGLGPWKPRRNDLYVVLYTRYLWDRFTYEPQYDREIFMEGIETMLEDSRLFIIDSNGIVAEGNRVFSPEISIDPISFVDQHPNVSSHQAIARLLLPFVESLTQARCKDNKVT